MEWQSKIVNHCAKHKNIFIVTHGNKYLLIFNVKRLTTFNNLDVENATLLSILRLPFDISHNGFSNVLKTATFVYEMNPWSVQNLLD